uniref:NADH-ubiquinone oxidoreductase chain 6 n=1 Tax=Xanthonycticebus pygmaeus TaxID=101278 RepID=A0A1L6CCC2_XANPY|nr:NADH dehydrogenase subunit 6 [Xanthonycticebus pygmaeus]APQ47833.1 NADH dehydrogenase subunit 6 [Xanthonycticebus pygmaeus]
MMYLVSLLSVLFVLGFVGFSSKPSPIYGGFGLIVSGGVGCGIVMGFGGSFMGLMVFLVYLGGMLVVFGYTTAMATEEYPESWGSSVGVLGALVLGLVVEMVLVLLAGDYYVEVGGVMNFDGVGDWEVYDVSGIGPFRMQSAGTSALYSCGSWFLVVAGWSLFVSIFIIIEITRGN